VGAWLSAFSAPATSWRVTTRESITASKACRNADIDWMRASGSFSNAEATIRSSASGTPSRRAPSSGAGACMCMNRTCAKFLLLKGTSPATIS
jgi:hypothetical protein